MYRPAPATIYRKDDYWPLVDKVRKEYNRREAIEDIEREKRLNSELI